MSESFKRKKIKVNIFYIGLPKCASTWLYENLKGAKNIVLSKPRDLHFFDLYFHRGEDWYHQFFEGIKEKSENNYMDICHDYLFYKSALERIKNYNPKSIIIIHFRNPLDLIYSLYDECYQSSFIYFLEHGYYRPSNFEDFLKHPFIHKILNYKKNIENVNKLFPAEQLLISSSEYIKENLEGYKKNFERTTKINFYSDKVPAIIIRPFNNKLKYMRLIVTLLSLFSMYFRRSGIPFLMRMINLKSYLNQISLKKNKNITLKLEKVRNSIFDLEILNLFKKINGMDYKTFIENYSTTVD